MIPDQEPRYRNNLETHVTQRGGACHAVELRILSSMDRPGAAGRTGSTRGYIGTTPCGCPLQNADFGQARGPVPTNPLLARPYVGFSTAPRNERLPTGEGVRRPCWIHRPPCPGSAPPISGPLQIIPLSRIHERYRDNDKMASSNSWSAHVRGHATAGDERRERVRRHAAVGAAGTGKGASWRPLNSST